eukprot:TRINITY_DN3815_c0_g1_i3.p1 TRINITY_DN3815_c0_g1~~TRINITY_DN3815_c0_g1_i3.p1  ORF type:complete len:569 (-),score=167.31 TRINITY_DN3815_c0_g1_i3:96-1802(-)
MQKMESQYKMPPCERCGGAIAVCVCAVCQLLLCRGCCDALHGHTGPYSEHPIKPINRGSVESLKQKRLRVERAEALDIDDAARRYMLDVTTAKAWLRSALGTDRTCSMSTGTDMQTLTDGVLLKALAHKLANEEVEENAQQSAVDCFGNVGFFLATVKKLLQDRETELPVLFSPTDLVSSQNLPLVASSLAVLSRLFASTIGVTAAAPTTSPLRVSAALSAPASLAPDFEYARALAEVQFRRRPYADCHHRQPEEEAVQDITAVRQANAVKHAKRVVEEFDEQQKAIEVLRAELETVRAQCKPEALAALEQRHQQLLHDLEDAALPVDVPASSVNLTAKREECEMLRKQVEESKTALKEMQRNREGAEAAAVASPSQLKQQLDKLTKKAHAASNAATRPEVQQPRAAHERAELERRREALQTECRELHRQLDEMCPNGTSRGKGKDEREFEALQRQLSKRLARKLALSRDVAELRGKFACDPAELEALTQALGKIREDVANLKAQISAIKVAIHQQEEIANRPVPLVTYESLLAKQVDKKTFLLCKAREEHKQSQAAIQQFQTALANV